MKHLSYDVDKERQQIVEEIFKEYGKAVSNALEKKIENALVNMVAVGFSCASDMLNDTSFTLKKKLTQSLK